MNFYLVIRVVVLLMLIFAAGFLTGRFTAPRQYVAVGPRGQIVTADVALSRLKSRIPLTPEQEQSFRKLLEELETEMNRYPPLSPERLERFRSYRPRMEALLTPEQKPAFDRFYQNSEARFEDAVRRMQTTRISR